MEPSPRPQARDHERCDHCDRKEVPHGRKRTKADRRVRPDALAAHLPRTPPVAAAPCAWSRRRSKDRRPRTSPRSRRRLPSAGRSIGPAKVGEYLLVGGPPPFARVTNLNKLPEIRGRLDYHRRHVGTRAGEGRGSGRRSRFRPCAGVVFIAAGRLPRSRGRASPASLRFFRSPRLTWMMPYCALSFRSMSLRRATAASRPLGTMPSTRASASWWFSPRERRPSALQQAASAAAMPARTARDAATLQKSGSASPCEAGDLDELPRQRDARARIRLVTGASPSASTCAHAPPYPTTRGSVRPRA